jgi:16S rRNA processing protein RimM
LGKVLKPRGLSGEVKVQVLTNIIDAFSFVPNVEKISFSGGFAFIKFKNVNTLEAAEAMRGKLIQIPFDKLPLADDEILVDDLIGFEVMGENGKLLGTVKKIEEVGASVVFDCGDLMFPYEDEFVIETNMTKRQIIVCQELLDAELVL